MRSAKPQDAARLDHPPQFPEHRHDQPDPQHVDEDAHQHEVEVAGVLDDCGSRFELDNGLVETDIIMPVTSRLIVNRAALKTDARVAALVERFRSLAEAA